MAASVIIRAILLERQKQGNNGEKSCPYDAFGPQLVSIPKIEIWTRQNGRQVATRGPSTSGGTGNRAPKMVNKWALTTQL